MNNVQEKNVCRLCLKVAFGYCLSITEEIASVISDVLLFYLDFHISDNPVMCKQCEENLHKAVGFKSSRKMFPSLYTREPESTDTKPCNFCISCPSVQVRPVPDADNNVFLLQIIRELRTKLKSVSADNPVACDNCFCIIQDILQFRETCLNAEEKIRTYIEIEGLNPNGQVDLDDVQTFEAKSTEWSFNDTEVKEVDVTKTISEKNDINFMNYTNTNSMEMDKIDETNEESELEVVNNFSVKEEIEFEFEVSEENKIEISDDENFTTLEDDFDSFKHDNLRIEEATGKAKNCGLLPEKSKALYEKTYSEYIKWCNIRKNTVKNYHSEKTLLAYFSYLSKERKPSSLWSYYSMLKATIKANHDVDIGNYPSLFGFLKRKSEGYKPKKSKVFTVEEIESFLYQAPDEVYLMNKVALIFGLAGSCRKQELVQLEVDDIQDLGSSLLVTLRDTKTKKNRMFSIWQPSFLDIYKKYASMRPPNTEIRRFFLAYKNGHCVRQVVGKNVFGEIPKKIATYLKLPNPELYTGHSFRRSSATVLTYSREGITGIKQN